MKKFLMGLMIAIIGGFAVYGMLSVFGITGRGLSAYELAVKYGYKGTESQWLESLKGKDGENGEDGVNYDDIKKLFENAKANGDYDGTFLNFVKDYISVYDIGSEVVANQCIMSSVSVSCYYKVNNLDYVSMGSGIVYDIDETNNVVYMITNYHVIYVYQNYGVAEDINVNVYGSEALEDEISCSFVGGSEYLDVAVIKATGVEAQKMINKGVEEVELAEFNDLSLGERLVAIGNPEGTGIGVVNGIVSADNRYVSYSISSKKYYHRVFQTDAQINSGNSGGGVFNGDGFLIGIVSSKYASDYSSKDGLDVVEGMSYCIPLTNVISAADYAIANCNGTTLVGVKAYDMGMTIYGANSSAHYDNALHRVVIKEDVGVTAIEIGSFASKLGLQAEDIFKNITIQKVNGKKYSFDIIRDFMVEDILMFLGAGDTIKIKVLRGGEEKTLTEYTTTASDNVYLKNLEILVKN